MTEYNGWVFYDGDCAVCRRGAAVGQELLLRYGFHLVPLQAPWVSERLAMTERELLREMKLLTADGRIFGGADAFVQIARSIWWTWPIYLVTLLPGVKPILRAIYRKFATQRRCLNGLCKTPQRCEKLRAHRHGPSAFYELP